MKKILAVILAAVFVIFSLSACASKQGNYVGDAVDKDTLVVCIDVPVPIEVGSMEPMLYELKVMLEDLGKRIQAACGIEKLAFEIMPHDGVERATAMQRLRTEIMSGGGPDVFIMHTAAQPDFVGPSKNAFFKFPEKNMEAGLFLPLDEYMENDTQFTDWDAQTQPVLKAGRTEEGQVVIPLTYTFPVLVYPESENKIPYTTDLTMQQILKNPETAEIGALLYSDILKQDENPVDFILRGVALLPSLLGKLADYETDQLLFSEDELYETLTETQSLYDSAAKNPHQYMKNFVDYWRFVAEVDNAYFDTDMAVVPLYSKDGGVTASINAYAAVNRNTDVPKDAFAVIDYIMQEEYQRTGKLYGNYLESGIPLQHDLGNETKPLRGGSFPIRYLLDEPYFEDLLRVKDQITAVNFETEIDAVLMDLLHDCHQSGTVTQQAVSEAYKKMKRMMGE